MDGEQNTPPNTLPDGTGRQRDRQTGGQADERYLGRISGQTKKEDKNKTGRGERTRSEGTDSQKLKREGWF